MKRSSKFTRLVVVALTVLGAAPRAEADSVHWGYTGDLGPASWSKLEFSPARNECAGARQSPIDLEEKSANRAPFPTLEFVNHDRLVARTYLVNNGHVVQGAAENENADVLVRGGPLDTDYKWIQFHFHTPGEHTVDGKSFPMELHLVYANTRYKDVPEASTHPDGLLTVAILFEVAASENRSLRPIVKGVSKLATTGAASVEVMPRVRLSAFLPTNTSKYFTYSGSLSTPPCSEAVTMVVLAEKVTATKNQLEVFKSLRNEEGQLIAPNNRPVQPLKGRLVRISFDPTLIPRQ
jgi:carbonic anhydrase